MKRELAQSIIEDIEIFAESKIEEAEANDVIECLQKRAGINNNSVLDFHQFNELLLLCIKTRVTEEFFEYFVQGKKKLKIRELTKLVDRFKKHSMLRYGNRKYAVNKLIRCKDIGRELGSWIKKPEDIIRQLRSRAKPISAIQKVARNKLHYLGFLTEDETKEIKQIRNRGKYNTRVFLTSDYMDVYVATSMRKQYDFQNVFDLCSYVFSEPKIKMLNLRYFDPTQSFHENRVAKGLIEGLMLKRAKCTIYAAQEIDSFGKDSELAATLAQGKPVIAYVPTYNPKDDKYLLDLYRLNLKTLLAKSDLYSTEISKNRRNWDIVYKFNEEISAFCEKNDRDDNKGNEKISRLEAEFKKSVHIGSHEFLKYVAILAAAEAEFYDKRAKVLQIYHPLGFQINLESGVANGVLVARTPKVCADILFDIMTNNLDFDIIKPGEKKRGYPEDDLNYMLCEKRSKCAFRVVTKDKMLTNSFWNFYLEEENENK